MRWAILLGVVFWGLLFAFIAVALAAPTPPAGYYKHGRDCAKIQQRVWGFEYWSSILLAQVHQESAWRADARSPWANGLTQFIPSTQRAVEQDIGIYGDIYDPEHACLLQAHLMLNLARSLGPKMDGYLGPWAFALRGYNGAPATLLREWRDCGRPRLWMAVEPCRARRPDFHRENTEYPHRIFRHWARIYWWLWEGA